MASLGMLASRVLYGEGLGKSASVAVRHSVGPVVSARTVARLGCANLIGLEEVQGSEGAGGTGGDLGAYYGLQAIAKKNQRNAQGCNPTMNDCTEPGYRLRRQGLTEPTAADIAFAVGAVALATGVTLSVLATQGSAPSAPVGFGPSGLRLEGTW